MLSEIYKPLATAAMVACCLPVCGQAPEVTSGNHPILRRAFSEHPEADKDSNGNLSLEEYQALQPKPPGEQAPPEGKLPYLPILPNGEVIVAEFEDNNYRNAKGWTNEGKAFQGDLAAGTRLMKQRVGPYRGKYFVTTFTTSDEGTGRLLSPEFPLELDFLSLTISGGGFPQRVCANLLIGEELVRTATGKNDDYFDEVAFDVRPFRGRMARLELLDQHRGLWGHLNLDRIVLTNDAGGARVINAKPAPIISPDGLALTTGGLQHGLLKIEDGKLVSARTPVPQNHLLLALNARAPIAETATGALRLLNGETWHAEIRNLEGRELTINSKLFGERKVPLSAIASIEFMVGSPSDPREAGHLYRIGGEPIPGKLRWIRQKDIAVDCALGVIPIPRETVERFVFADPQPPAELAVDTIGLMDGGVLHGGTSFEGNQVLVSHPALGDLKLEWNAVRYLRRQVAGLTWLEQAKMTVLERIGPALPPPPPRWHEANDDSHLHALRIMPHTVVRFALKTGPNRNGLFRTQLSAVPGSRADLKVTILAGGATLWDQRVAAGSKPIPLSLDLSNAEEFTIEVQFDGPLAFPCGIDLRDAHVLNIAQIESQTKQPN